MTNKVRHRYPLRLGITFALLAMASTAPYSANAAKGHSQDHNSVSYLSGSGVLPDDLPFSEAVKVNNTLYLSGQLGMDPKTKKLVKGGIKAEAKQTMDNIKAVLTHHGYSMDHLVKCTVMLADISEWAEFNNVYVTYFDKHFPARSAFGANGLALKARLEVECIAVK
ncbi:Rid family detoxifying hydrolase [Flocculibacter collagenilyticus]|uniref:Rid family detoxifying hydrolase n=1 Tax=Flocculibacter collagenilyticus TaxID=2744479 RepID=UPI001F37A959|nr:Rid family detoxifying hydrolase [Flocculibacter collagenilyticus]